MLTLTLSSLVRQLRRMSTLWLYFSIFLQLQTVNAMVESSVADPDPNPDPPDPHVFGPPGSESISQRYGSG